MDIKSHQIRALLAVAMHGSLRGGAAALGLTQAALTKSLRKLEEDVGLALLLRTPHGVQLTEAGVRLHARASLVERQLELLRADLAADGKAGEAVIRLSVTPLVAASGLVPAQRAFRDHHPGAPLCIAEGFSLAAVRGLRDGSLDFAFAHDDGDIPLDEFEVEAIASAPRCLALRAGHPLLQGGAAVTPEAVLRLEWLVMGSRAGSRSPLVAGYFRSLGLKLPAQVLRCDAVVGLSLLRSTDAVGIVAVPLLESGQPHGLRRVEVQGLALPPVHVVALRRRDVALTGEAEELRRGIAAAVRRAAQGWSASGSIEPASARSRLSIAVLSP